MRNGSKSRLAVMVEAGLFVKRFLCVGEQYPQWSILKLTYLEAVPNQLVERTEHFVCEPSRKEVSLHCFP